VGEGEDTIHRSGGTESPHWPKKGKEGCTSREASHAAKKGNDRVPGHSQSISFIPGGGGDTSSASTEHGEEGGAHFIIQVRKPALNLPGGGGRPIRISRGGSGNRTPCLEPHESQLHRQLRGGNRPVCPHRSWMRKRRKGSCLPGCRAFSTGKNLPFERSFSAVRVRGKEQPITQDHPRREPIPYDRVKEGKAIVPCGIKCAPRRCALVRSYLHRRREEKNPFTSPRKDKQLGNFSGSGREKRV